MQEYMHISIVLIMLYFYSILDKSGSLSPLIMPDDFAPLLSPYEGDYESDSMNGLPKGKEEVDHAGVDVSSS